MSFLQNYLKSCAFAAVGFLSGVDQQLAAQSFSPVLKPNTENQRALNEAFAIGFSVYPNDSVAQVMKQDIQDNLPDYHKNGLSRRQKIFPHGATKMDTYTAAGNGMVQTIMRTLDKPNEVYETIFHLNGKNPYHIPTIRQIYQTPFNDSLHQKRETEYSLLPAYRLPGDKASDYKITKDALIITQKDNREKRITRTCSMTPNGRAEPCRVTVFNPGLDPDTKSIVREVTPYGVVTTEYCTEGTALEATYDKTIQAFNAFELAVKAITGASVYDEQFKDFVQPNRAFFDRPDNPGAAGQNMTKPVYKSRGVISQPKAKPKVPVKTRSKSSLKTRPRPH